MNRVGIPRVTLEQVYMMGVRSSILWDMVKWTTQVRANNSKEYWLAVRSEYEDLVAHLS